MYSLTKRLFAFVFSLINLNFSKIPRIVCFAASFFLALFFLLANATSNSAVISGLSTPPFCDLFLLPPPACL